MDLVLPGLGNPVSGAAATLPLYHDTYVGTTVYTDKLSQDLSTLTVAQANGFLTLNAGASLTDGAWAFVRTLRTFPLFQSFPVVGEWFLKTANDAETTARVEWGFGYSAAGSAVVTDGVFFRLSVVSGLPRLQGVMSYNGTETVTDLLVGSANLPTAGQVHRYRIEVRHAHVVFVVDTVGFLVPMSVTQGLALSSFNASAYALVGNGTGATAARSISIAEVAVYARELLNGKQWGAVLAGMGLGAQQVPSNSGVAVGQTANWVNSTAPASATLLNTAAGYNALGGQYQFAANATNETDWALFEYQSRAAFETQVGRTLYVTGIRIGEMIVTGAAAVNPTTFFWAVGVNGAGASLATADSATAQSFKRIALGAQSFLAAAPLGTVAPGFHVPFDTAPLVVPAGQRLAIILKQLNGAATASLVWRGTVSLMGYFE